MFITFPCRHLKSTGWLAQKSFGLDWPGNQYYLAIQASFPLTAPGKIPVVTGGRFPKLAYSKEGTASESSALIPILS